MSFEAIAWAVRQKLPFAQKIVLVMLSDRHNSDTGRCDPSHERLSSDCGMTRRSVLDQLARLDAAGFIRTIHRMAGKLKTSNQYALNLSFGAKPDVKEFHIDVQEIHNSSARGSLGVVNVVHQGSEPVAHKPVIEPVIEPKEKSACATLVLPGWINVSHWDTWHACTNRKKTTVAQQRMTIEKLERWRAEGVDWATALEDAAIGGWAGLHKPDTKKTNGAAETVYQRSMRERVAEISPSLARAPPGQSKPTQNITEFFEKAPAMEIAK